MKFKGKTIFRAIGNRKRYDSLGILMRYILKSVDTLENEFGESIKVEDIPKEFKRFEMIKDEDNLKHNVLDRDTKEGNLKNRQMWHAVFSLPNHLANPEDFHKAMREGLNELFLGHKYVFAVHGNTNNYHCHIALKTKNDITKKQLRLETKDLFRLNKVLHDKCVSYGIDMTKPIDKDKETDKSKNTKKKVIGGQYAKKTKDWKLMYEFNNFPKITTNSKTMERLRKLGMSEENIYSFLHMYKEDQGLAVWSINENSKLFGIKKPKERFNLRKVKLIEGEKKVKDSINKDDER